MLLGLVNVSADDEESDIPVIGVCERNYVGNELVTFPIHGEVDGLGYMNLGDGTASIVRYNGETSHLVIPETIDGLTVTKINMLFRACSGRFITQTIELPDTLEEIGDSAFSNTPLTSVDIPASVKRIGRNAFYYSHITSVTFREGLESIGNQAFFNNQIEYLVIPESVKSIGNHAFDDNENMKSITIKNKNISIGNQAFIKHLEEKPLIIGYVESTAKTYADKNGHPFQDILGFDYEIETLSDGTAKIINYIGEETEHLTIPSMIMGHPVSEIGDGVFQNIGASSITIPEGVKRIGAHAFASNELETIQFPSTLEEIGHSAFKDNRLQSVDIPENLTVIPKEAFANNRLNKVDIPEAIQRIEDQAFYGNPPLEEVWLYRRDLSLGENLFLQDGETLPHIYAEADSNGITYAQQNGHSFSPWYHVYYYENGNITEKIPTDEQRYFQNDQAIIQNMNGSVEGYIFIGWNENPDGTGQMYGANEAVPIINAHLHLYAIWEKVEFAGGSGTQNDPFLIANAEQLDLVRKAMDKHYKLIADIDLSGYNSWIPLGLNPHTADFFDAIPFTGTFDGNGHVISNLTISNFKRGSGLFSVIEGKANGSYDDVYVRNLGIENILIHSTSVDVGALAGEVRYATISNIYIRNRLGNGFIYGSMSTGGLIGRVHNSILENVFNENVLIMTTSGGGIVGFYLSELPDSGYMKNVYTIGEVANTWGQKPSFGAIVGSLSLDKSPEVINGYWNSFCNGCTFNVNLGKEVTNPEQLKQKATFSQWDFDSDWLLLENQNMNPALRVFHPVTDLQAQLEESTTVIYTGDTPQIKVWATYKNIVGQGEETGSSAIQYNVITGEELVEINNTGEVTAIAPGTVEIDVSLEGKSTRLSFTILREVPDVPHEIIVPDIPKKGGTAVTFDWQAPTDWGAGTERHFKVRFFNGNDWGKWEEVKTTSWTFNLPDHLDTKSAQIEVKSVTERGESDSVLSDVFTVISTSPQITLKGDNPITLSIKDTYEELGFTAEDAFGTDLTAQVEVSGEVLAGQLGTYTLTYKVEDAAGHVTEVNRIVKVINDVPPEIVLNGDNPYILIKGSDYVDPGSSAIDYFGEAVEVSHNASEVVQVDEIGAYKVTYIAEDEYGNEVTAKRIVHVIPPAPSIIGGFEEIIVNDAEPHATIELYNIYNRKIQSTKADEKGTALLTEVVPGQTYYVTQTVNQMVSHPSNGVEVFSKVAPLPPSSVTEVTLKEGGKLFVRWEEVSNWGTGQSHAYEVELWMNGNIQQTMTVDASAIDELPTIEWAIPLDIETDSAKIRVKSVTNHGDSAYAISETFAIQFPEPGQPLIQLSETDWTNEEVMVTIQHGEVGWVGLQHTLYRLNDGEYTEYTGPFTVTNEGKTTIEAYTIDQSNRISTEAAQVDVYIDRTGPQVYFSTNGNSNRETEVSTIVTVTDEWAGLDEDSLSYMWRNTSVQPDLDDSNWTPFVNGNTLTLEDRVGEWYLHILAKDRLGNITNVRSEAFMLTKVYNLTYTAGTGGTLHGEASQTAFHGDNGQTITAVPDAGYYFVKWSDGKTEATRTDVNVTTHIAVTAEFARRSSGGGSGGVSSPKPDDEKEEEEDEENQEEPEEEEVDEEDPNDHEEEEVDEEDPDNHEEEDKNDDPSTDPEVTFQDISGHWAENDIKNAVRKHIISGYPDGTFKPNKSITRAEFTLILVNFLQLDGATTSLTFTDIDQIGDWSKHAIELAVEAGIVNGYHDGSFRPNAQITREEMAVMITRALGILTDANSQSNFSDDEDISDWAKGAVEAIRQHGIVNGRGGNRFVPKESATRSEAVVMLLRLLEKEENR